jgi:hypothetical protein
MFQFIIVIDVSSDIWVGPEMNSSKTQPFSQQKGGKRTATVKRVMDKLKRLSGQDVEGLVKVLLARKEFSIMRRELEGKRLWQVMKNLRRVHDRAIGRKRAALLGIVGIFFWQQLDSAPGPN